MAIVFLKDSTLTAIANAIRGKLGTTETMLPSEMAGLIDTITGGGGESLPVKSGIVELNSVNTIIGPPNGGKFYMCSINAEKAIYSENTEIRVGMPASDLGNAQATSFEVGTTATSMFGSKLDGKLVTDSVKTQEGGSINLNWSVDNDGFRRATLAESISLPSYTLQIMTTNPGDGSDTIVYYAPGSSEKTNLTLTGEYQSITCGDFIALHRGSVNNVTTLIYFRNNADSNVKSIGVSDKYAVGLNPHGSWSVINIGALIRDYPTITKIRIGYSD